MAVTKLELPRPPMPPFAAYSNSGSVISTNTSPEASSVTIVPTGTRRVGPLRPSGRAATPPYRFRRGKFAGF